MEILSQTRPSTNTLRKLSLPWQPHAQADAWYGQKKPISLQKHAPSFMHLKVESHRPTKATLTCQDLERDSETRSQILLFCMKCPYKNPTFRQPQCVRPLVVLFRLTSCNGWSSCFTLVFENPPPLLSVAGDARCPPRGTLGNTLHYCKHQRSI